MTAPGQPTEAAVVEAGYRNDHDFIERAATSADPAIRRAAIGALLRTGRLEAERLQHFATDVDPRVRRRAAELAPRLDDAPLTESFLVGLLADEPEIVEVACFALGEVGSADGADIDTTTIGAIETIARSHDDALCREAAVASLGALHVGLDTILAACDDKATVRRRAVIALAPFEGLDVDRALQTALSDRDWQVRQAAEDLIADPTDGEAD
jgi:HEAT repeat protein